MSVRPIVDVTRTVLRQRHLTLSGIDRVELAYLRWAAESGGAAMVSLGRSSWVVPSDGLPALLEAIARPGLQPLDWRARATPLRAPGRLRLESAIRRLGNALDDSRTGVRRLRDLTGRGGIYFNVGQDHGDGPAARLAKRAGITRVAMIHDLIPIAWPQLSRPEAPARFRRRLAALMGYDALLANSETTAAEVAAMAAAAGEATPPLTAAPLGVSETQTTARQDDGPPSFVILGTIEPRKNHLLLFQIWERLARGDGPVPVLHVVGRRGWECEQVLDWLDRAPVAGRGGAIVEHPAIDDGGVAALMAGARALLMPSLAEGFGLPVAEALAAGLPVICSDLPAHREAGRDAPVYLDPLDGAAWMAAIRVFAEGGAMRDDAIARTTRWQAPRWGDHFAKVVEVSAALSAG